jgi:ribose transport system ATP-binding protein
MGENGAGKSTMVKVLTGVIGKDEGTIKYKGEFVDFTNIRQSQAAGIAIIHQELNMIPHLSVAANFFLGREKLKGIFLSEKEMINQCRKALIDLKLNIDPETIMRDLTVGNQQMVEIAKSVNQNADLLVLDEPTAALTEVEIDSLFAIMEDLRNRDIGMIYISHRMEEIKRITDRVTVFRDGEYIGTVESQKVTKDEVINMMIGRVIYEAPKLKSNVKPDAPVVLEVKSLNAGNKVKDVSFTLRKGEILGFAGLMGAGRTEMARLIFGADKKDSGEVYINGKLVRISQPSDAVALGMGYLSEDRKRYGCALKMSMANNCALASMDKYTKNGIISDKEIEDNALDYIGKLSIKTPSVEQLLFNLSGGNQQKVIIAKWLDKDSDIIIFDEPTRGIDVGSKSEIYHLINVLADEGKSIILISRELPEILRLSDRICVMCEGRLTGEIDIGEANQGDIMNLATMN